ncbi:MAG: FecR domain-containing protein [Chitinophagaceae bacterium]
MKDAYSLDPRDEERAQRVAYLVSGYLRQSLTEAELDELDAWIVASDENQELFEELIDRKNIEAGILKQKGIDTEKALRKIKEQMGMKSLVPVKKTNRSWAYAIAASVLLLAGIFFYTRSGKDDTPKKEIVNEVPDLKPGGNKATLKLADGSIIDLATQKMGVVSNENGTLINKVEDGQLIYSADATATTEIKYNTLVTPKGGQYKVVLPDSTVVWLNAASSLKYPVAFGGAERVVELTGEGYFEVAKNGKRPFKVRLKNNATVEVLGTHFNINAYDDEEYIRATLLEGSVNISSKKVSLKMMPGQQMLLQNNGDMALNRDVSQEEVTAWKEGEFSFKKATIESIMRQVARWYDVDISYEGKTTYHFNVTISRNEPVSKLFKILELTNRVHFTIEGKRIIVKS